MRLPRRRAACWVRLGGRGEGGAGQCASRAVPPRHERRGCQLALWRFPPFWLSLPAHSSSRHLSIASAGLSLPQAQVLAELFGGRSALLDPPRPATIKNLIAFQAAWDRHPALYDQICQVGLGPGVCLAWTVEEPRSGAIEGLVVVERRPSWRAWTPVQAINLTG